MTLQDLKKQAFANKRKQLKITPDEFINQASLYALGISGQQVSDYDNVIDFATGKPIFVMLGRVDDKGTENKTSEKARFKNATFSLSHHAIVQLNKLSHETGLAKSHVLRVLINEYYELPKDERKKIINGSKK